MILIGLGGNLPSDIWGPPRRTLEAALGELAARGVQVAKLSRWYETAPVPVSDQPWFINAVAAVETSLPPRELLGLLHDVEESFGRLRRERWEARIIDLDLLAYNDLVLPDAASWQRQEGDILLPHPRLHLRRFVLEPICDIDPNWVHPVIGLSARRLLLTLPTED
jgi:2-amino-4-hydroxy-6-hydroxymethyldihydropteridine diphosphokinase